MEYDDKKERALTRDDIKCPDGWLWKADWCEDRNRAVDEDGEIQTLPTSLGYLVITLCYLLLYVT